MREYKSLMFIGDPHASSRKVGRRKVGYGEGVLDKLRQSGELARTRAAVPIILGDLLHTSAENDLAYLNRLVTVLKGFGQPVYVLDGNHDKAKAELGEQDALALLFNLECVVHLSSHDFLVNEQVVHVTGIGHGEQIPDSVPRINSSANILVTHHDLAFGGVYPGALPLKAIEGIDMVVNGHMHDTKKSVRVGGTLWHNPGNIEPVSIDLREHVPAVWFWAPGQGDELSRVVLSHDIDCFDLTGLNVEANSDALSAVESLLPESGPGQFVQELLVEDSLAAERTDDASILKDDLDAVLTAGGYSDAVSAYLTRLLEKSLVKP